MPGSDPYESVLKAVDDVRDEMVDFLRQLVRIDTAVPPGNNYPECAELLRAMMARLGYEAQLVQVPADFVEGLMRARGIPVPHDGFLPRVNVFGRKEGRRKGPTVHFTGHFDVVPVGPGWMMEPFGAVLKDGRVYGRGATDQKSGLAASLFAIEALRRAGFELPGTVEQSATVDEESGGETGLGYLVEKGLIGKGRQDCVVITECLDVDGICLGHRGLLMFTLVTTGRIGHGCMPDLAINAVDKMTFVMNAIATELRPSIESRVSPQPIMPEGSRRSSLSPIWIDGAAALHAGTTIPALCTTMWNRWFNPEEDLASVRRELMEFLERVRARDPELHLEMIEHFSAQPVAVSPERPVVKAWQNQVRAVLGRESHLVLSPGIDDQRFVVVNGGIEDCILYGPGVLSMAHAPDEFVPLDDLVNATAVMALGTLEVMGGVR